MTFRVDLDIFRGPLDLLLYLVRKHEVDATDIPIAAVTEQFLEHVSVLEQIDVNLAGDFLELAGTLIEIKSRMVLPQGGEEEPLEDPRQDLVRQLLQYKRYRDAASMLDERSRAWQERFARLANDLPPRSLDPAEQPIHEVELWDLVSAFGRIIRETEAAKPSSIVYDDTPIHVHMARIQERLLARGHLAFSGLFERGMHKSSLIGVFLAVLELVRHKQVLLEQNQLFGEIWLLPRADGQGPLDLSQVDTYGHAP